MMSFDLNILGHGTSKRVQLIDQQNGTLIELQAKGGLMNRWMVKNENQSLELVLGNSGMTNIEMNGFRSGKMSPFSCRIRQGQYNWDATTFRFNKFYYR